MEKIDVTIAGAGVIGLATARALSSKTCSVAIAERNPRHGMETSSRNSEVIHSGIYYKPGSLKAALCTKGRDMLYSYCAANNIPFRKSGKLIAAFSSNEIPALEKLYRRGIENNVPELRIIGREEIKQICGCPSITAAIHSPCTGILSSDALMDKLLAQAVENDAILMTGTEITGIKKEKNFYRIETNSQEPFLTRIFINCAGHGADKLAAIAGFDTDTLGYRQMFVKGEYFRLAAAHKSDPLLYPLPDNMGLGLHITPDIKGRLRIGPNAFQTSTIDYSVKESGAKEFLFAAQRFISGVHKEEIFPDTAGIRPRLKNFPDGSGDFLIHHETDREFTGFVNLCGIESPGLTASLAIAEHVREIIKDIL